MVSFTKRDGVAGVGLRNQDATHPVLDRSRATLPYHSTIPPNGSRSWRMINESRVSGDIGAVFLGAGLGAHVERYAVRCSVVSVVESASLID